MLGKTTTVEKAWSLIIPDETERRTLVSSGKHLVHYTDFACEILASNEFRLRNARKMHDATEITLGRNCVNEFLTTHAAKVASALNDIQPNLYKDLVSLWTAEKEAKIDQTFIACFTIQDGNENQGSNFHWQHYGKVALCLDPSFLHDEPSQLSLYLLKVTYGYSDVMAGLHQLLDAIHTNRNVLRTVPPEVLLSFLRHKLFFVSVSSKGAGFADEKEWRLIHAPFLFPSAHVMPGERIYGQTLEHVHLLEMEVPLGTNLTSLATKELIRKVLIHSECATPAHDLRRTLVSKLRYHGVEDAASRVLVFANA